MGRAEEAIRKGRKIGREQRRMEGGGREETEDGKKGEEGRLPRVPGNRSRPSHKRKAWNSCGRRPPASVWSNGWRPQRMDGTHNEQGLPTREITHERGYPRKRIPMEENTHERGYP